MRVPICTPSAPSAKAAAIVRPSQMPPAAMTGTSTFEQTSGSSTIVATSRGFLKPPPSPPSTTRPSTPASTAFRAAASVGHDVEDGEPGVLQLRRVLASGRRPSGHELHALVDHEVDDAGSRTKSWAMFTPKGLSVRSRILRISSRTASSSPDDVSMMPRPPAFGHRRGQLRAGDPAHRRLHDRVADAEQLGDTRATAGRGSRHRCSFTAAWTAAMIGIPVGPWLAGHGHEVVHPEQVGHAGDGEHVALRTGWWRRPPSRR